MSSRVKGAPAHPSRRPARARPPASAPRPSLPVRLEVSEGLARSLGWAALGVIAAFALALLVMALRPHRIGDYFTETDFYGAYAQGARLIQHGQWLPARYGVVGPGYEAALAVAGLVVRDLFLAAELLSIAAASVTLWLWFDLLRRRFDPRAALLAVLFLVTNAFFFRYGYAATTDTPAMALQALALWLLLARGGARAVGAAGMVSALAFLTRYNAIYLLPAGLIAIVGGAVRGARAAAPAPAPHTGAAPEAPGPSASPAAGAGRLALLFLIGFFAPVVPWVLYSLAHGGQFSFQLHHNIAYEVFARSRGIVWDDYQRDLQPQFHNLWDVIRRDPPAVFARMGLNLFDHLGRDSFQLMGWPVALAALLGMVLAWRARVLVRLWPIGAAAALLFLSLVPAFYSERYSLPLAPIYAALAGAAFGLPVLALRLGRGGRVWGKLLIAAIPLALATTRSVAFEKRTLDQLPVEVLDAAGALRPLARPGDKVIARKGHLAYYSGLEPLAFPFASTLPELAAFAHQHAVRWLFISWPEVETRPKFWPLLDTTAVVPGLTVRHVTRPHPSVLYEIGPEFGQVPAWYANDTLFTWHSARATLLVTPNDTKAMISLALVERARGNFDGAREWAERAAAIDPDKLRALLLMGEMALTRNDLARAQEVYQRVLARDPRNADGLVGLGWTQLLSGNVEQAASTWRPTVTLVRDPTTLERMAQVFAHVGDRATAELALTRLRTLRAQP